MELDLENDDGSDDLNPAGSDSELEEFTIEDSPAEKNEELEEVLDMSEMASANEDRAKEGSRQTKALKKLEFVKVSWSCSVRSFGKIARTYHQSRTEVALTNQWLQVFDDKQKGL